MYNPKQFDEVVCLIRETLISGIMNIDFYEVVVKENGLPGRLLCFKVPALVYGQEFTAQFVDFDVDGNCLLQNLMYERNGDGKLVLKPEFESPNIPGGGILIPFPRRRNET